MQDPKQPGPEQDVNRRYFVEYVTAAAPRGAAVLDFGCGDGDLVVMLQEAGYAAQGCDIHWPGAGYRFNERVAPNSLHYFQSGGRLPFDDNSFDVVVSDQVFEHVVPLEQSVAELDRILKPDGVAYHHFPTREVWREGHIGIPFAHRLPPGRMRLRYTTLLRRLGAGIYKDERSAEEWAREKLNWIDEWTVYRPTAEIVSAFARTSTVRHREVDYCRFRAQDRRWMQALLKPTVFAKPSQWLFRHLGFVAIECRPRDVGQAA